MSPQPSRSPQTPAQQSQSTRTPSTSVSALLLEVPELPRDELTSRWLHTTLGREDGVPPQHGQALRGILEDLGVPHQDIDAGLRLEARRERFPQLTALRNRAAGALLADLGRPPADPPPPEFAGTGSPQLRYFWMLVYADLVPAVTAWHVGHGISPEVTRRTLADLGRRLTLSQRRFGYRGLTIDVDWLRNHFQGQLFQLGRLQFEMTKLGRTTAAEIAATGRSAAAGDPCLAVHIPDYCGPFSPGDCLASFALAATFFADHFPEFHPEVVTCHSWLLDRRLPDYLSPTANIVEFQRLFTVSHREDAEHDRTTFAAVFGTNDHTNLDALPQDTSLQRALVQHLRDGHHWYGGAGWRPLVV